MDDADGAGPPKRGRGRPPKHVFEPLPATATEILAAIFRDADGPEPPIGTEPPESTG